MEQQGGHASGRWWMTMKRSSFGAALASGELLQRRHCTEPQRTCSLAAVVTLQQKQCCCRRGKWDREVRVRLGYETKPPDWRGLQINKGNKHGIIKTLTRGGL